MLHTILEAQLLGCIRSTSVGFKTFKLLKMDCHHTGIISGCFPGVFLHSRPQQAPWNPTCVYIHTNMTRQQQQSVDKLFEVRPQVRPPYFRGAI